MKIDVLMPTYGVSPDTLQKTLVRLTQSFANSPLSLGTLRVDYRPANDYTDEIIREWAVDEQVSFTIHEGDRTLPASREFLFDKADTEWFLFLDDDVWLRDDTLAEMYESIAPSVGGIQVRKACHEDSKNGSWSKWRNVRGTTFATLIRTSCVEDCSIPAEITQLEDEYIRQHIENQHDKLWLFDHQAIIDHDNQGRHEINYTEGKLAAKYDLLPYDYVFGNVPYNILTLGNPVRHTMRALGYTVGKLR